MNPSALKKNSAEAASREIQSGDVVGLGTGTTVYHAIKYLGELVKNEGLGIVGIPTSIATEKTAKENGITLGTLEEYHEVDVAIDGADQVDSHLNLIKGGGGALVREKIVASIAKRFIVIVDESKVVKGLNMPVPVEVLPFALGLVINKIEELGGTPLLRLSGKDYFISDNNNYIIDADFGGIKNPHELEGELNKIYGVVDNGIFVDMATEVFVGTDRGIRIMRPNR